MLMGTLILVAGRRFDPVYNDLLLVRAADFSQPTTIPIEFTNALRRFTLLFDRVDNNGILVATRRFRSALRLIAR